MPAVILRAAFPEPFKQAADLVVQIGKCMIRRDVFGERMGKFRRSMTWSGRRHHRPAHTHFAYWFVQRALRRFFHNRKRSFFCCERRQFFPVPEHSFQLARLDHFWRLTKTAMRFQVIQHFPVAHGAGIGAAFQGILHRVADEYFGEAVGTDIHDLSVISVLFLHALLSFRCDQDYV